LRRKATGSFPKERGCPDALAGSGQWKTMRIHPRERRRPGFYRAISRSGPAQPEQIEQLRQRRVPDLSRGLLGSGNWLSNRRHEESRNGASWQRNETRSRVNRAVESSPSPCCIGGSVRSFQRFRRRGRRRRCPACISDSCSRRLSQRNHTQDPHTHRSCDAESQRTAIRQRRRPGRSIETFRLA